MFYCRVLSQEVNHVSGVSQKTRGQKAYADGCTYLYWEFGDCFVKHPKTDRQVKPVRTVVRP